MKQKLLNLKSLLLLLLMTVSMGARAQAVYNSLSELAEAIEAGNVAQASKVSVSFNSVITEIRPERTSQSIVLKDGDYTFELTADALCDEGWTVGGKLATKTGKKWTAWYSGVYQPTGSDKIYMLYNSDDADAAWDNLTYTAPENYTLSGLAGAANAENVKNGEMVSVSLNNEITEIKFENQTQFVVVKDGDYTFQLTANAHCSTDWKVGGKLVGDNWIARYLGSYSLNGVDRIHMLYNNTDAAWDNLTYTAPENYTLSELAEAANAENVKNGEMVSVSLNNEITEIKFENQTQFVVVKDGDYTFQLTANAHCSTDWKVGGKLVGDNWIARYLGSYSLNGVDRIHMLYNNTDAAWADLTYTAPIPTFNSLDELEAANLPNGTHVNVYIEGTVQSALTMGSEYSIYFTDKLREFCCLTTDIQYEPEWYQPDGMLTGTLKNVVCVRSGNSFSFKSPNASHNIFEGLEFTPNYKSLNDLYAAIGGIGIGSWVPVKLNENEIVKITDDAVCVKEGDNVFALKANSRPNWKVGGTLENTWLAKYQGWDEELKAYTLQYAAKNSNPWSDLYYVFTETYASLEELIKSGQKSGPINVTINNVILGTWDNEGMWYVYVQSGNEEICLKAPLPDSKPDWLPGGTLEAALTKVSWSNPYLRGTNKEFWDNFTYTPPVVTEYESIADLLAADIQGVAVVTVKNINNQISKIEKQGNYYDVYLDDNKIFLSGDYNPDRDWEAGGTLTGKLENVIFATDEDEGTALYLPDEDILEGLTYTAPAVGTISISSVGYTTYFTDKEFTMPEGLEGYVVTPKDETSVTLTKVFEGGDIVPASTPLLIKGKEGKHSYTFTNTGATFTGENCLHGNLRAGWVEDVEGADLYYKLMNGSNGLGWYLGAQDGGVFTLGANKAYLALSGTQAQNAKSLSLVFDDATAIENINADAENARTFNLAGQRVKANHKGIVVVNGKKIVNK